jgi:hypothetical protein
MTMRHLLVVLAVLAFSRPAHAQPKPSCSAGKTGKATAITAKEAWDLAHARALAWQKDAIPFDLTTTSDGPLDSSGRSTDWDAKFSSAAAKAVDMISISDGQIRCFAIGGEGGQPIQFDEKIILDTKALYETAQRAGGAALGPGAMVMAGLVPERRTEGTESWYLNYQDAGGREVLSVVIGARSGAVRNVFHTGK